MSADKVTDKDGNKVSSLEVFSVDTEVTSYGGTQRVSMQYSYALSGTTYYVYQAYVRTTFADYMYTFTAKAPIEGDTLSLAVKILHKIAF